MFIFYHMKSLPLKRMFYGQSCATFVLRSDNEIFIGHNLDENNSVPGLIVANPRNVPKKGISWGMLKTGKPEKSGFEWKSKFASLTYNTFGKDLIDGGMNEAGLYVGEMTLFPTEYPSENNTINLYHHNWMQYLLDNFATVNEVLDSLTKIQPDGHCKWHFLIADEKSNCAVVEFLDKKVRIYSEDSLPYKILCNDTYEAELKDLAIYKEFGGEKTEPEKKYDREDPRFRWAALMLRQFDGEKEPVRHSFSILERMDMGNNKWRLVYDVKNMCLHFNTAINRNNRSVRLSNLKVEDGGKSLALDIDCAQSGDVSGFFKPLTGEIHEEFVRKAWSNIDAGVMGNALFKPKMVKNMIRFVDFPL